MPLLSGKCVGHAFGCFLDGHFIVITKKDPATATEHLPYSLFSLFAVSPFKNQIKPDPGKWLIFSTE